jgi:WD40 repeat protein
LNWFDLFLSYKQGGIVILDVKHDQMKILHKLKNHEDSINFLFWFPMKESDSNSDDFKKLEDIYKTNDFSMILCSSSEDKTIRLWCASKGVQLKLIKAPGVNTSSTSKTQAKGQQVAKINYTPLCWPNPTTLISGSFKYEN